MSTDSTRDATILVIDDERVVRDMLSTALERFGYSVLVAPDGRAGLDLYRERGEEVSLVLLDLCMPGLSGVEVLAQLREMDPQLRVAVLTGYVEEYQVPNDVELVYKPFSLDELVDLVRRLLR